MEWMDARLRRASVRRSRLLCCLRLRKNIERDEDLCSLNQGSRNFQYFGICRFAYGSSRSACLPEAK